jgi:hypothetical protein
MVGGGSDSQREGQDGQGGEGRVLVEHARGLTGVGGQVVQHVELYEAFWAPWQTTANQSQLLVVGCPVLGIGVAVLRPEEHRQECLCYAGNERMSVGRFW